MKEYLDLLFKKEKKPITIDKIFSSVEKMLLRDKPDCVFSIDEKKKILEFLDIGLRDYEYYETPDKKYTLLSKSPYRVGTYYSNANDGGTVIIENSYYDRDGKYVVYEKKYMIDSKHKQEAIDGDKVLIELLEDDNARVVKVVHRNLYNIIGVITREKDLFFLNPLDRKKKGITICLEEKDLVDGAIALVSLENTSSTNFYRGTVEKYFNHKDDPQEDAYLLAVKCGMPVGFSKESLEQLKSIQMVVTEEDKVGRYDFTDWEIFSIDGASTKDKDDCISYKKLPNGHSLLGAHIEDSPAHIPTNSPIHKDAFIKGTSYYFGGGVEPMLPRKLSNGICSLFDGVERLTKSTLIEYDENGEVVHKELVKGVIHSKIGMTYEKVNEIFHSGIIAPEYEEFVPTLYDMKDFALLLRKKRAQEGSLIINKPEVYFIYDENKYPIEPRVKYQDLAEIIIEEFMIAGNIGFIETMIENGAPCIYRVEDEINRKNQKKLDEFLKLLKALGNPFYYSSPQIIANRELLQGLVDHISNFGPLSMVLMTHFIKCMSHAYYSVENSGHYGIGKRNYGHTTSPDRRLSDDTNSRSADDCVLEQDPEKRKKSIHYWDSVLPDYARRATDMERVSETVERRVFDLETCMYFERHIGEEYDGTVVSFDDKDIHIILDNLLEGVVRCNTLTGKYTYNSDQYTLLSLDGEENYYLGDRLKLEVLYTDREYNIVYFKVLEKIDENFIEDKDDSNIRAKTLAKIKREEAFK